MSVSLVGGTASAGSEPRRRPRCSQIWRAMPAAATSSPASETIKAMRSQCMTAKAKNTRWREGRGGLAAIPCSRTQAAMQGSRCCRFPRAEQGTPASGSCAGHAAALRVRRGARRWSSTRAASRRRTRLLPPAIDGLDGGHERGAGGEPLLDQGAAQRLSFSGAGGGGHHDAGCGVGGRHQTFSAPVYERAAIREGAEWHALFAAGSVCQGWFLWRGSGEVTLDP